MTQPTQNGSVARPPDGAPRRGIDAQALARGLGWLSLGLGIAQVTAPRALDRVIGVAPSRRRASAMRAIGAREIATGIGILTLRRPVGFLVGRVLGDVMDLALLGSSLRGPRVRRGRLVAATASVVGMMILDTLAGAEVGLGGPRADELEGEERIERVSGVMTIARAPADIYRFLRDLRNAPRFMGGIRSVEVIDERRSRWTATLPGGTTASWDTEVVDDRPGESFAFRALGGSSTALSGEVRCSRAPGDRGAFVRLTLSSPKGGPVAGAFAKLLGPALELKAKADLRRLKQIMEVGEVTESDASIHRGPHPARPSAEPRGAQAAAGRGTVYAASKAGEDEACGPGQGPTLVVGGGSR